MKGKEDTTMKNEMIEKFYFDWSESMVDNDEVKQSYTHLNNFKRELSPHVDSKQLNELDNLLMEIACKHQEQGFEAGYKTAMKIMFKGLL